MSVTSSTTSSSLVQFFQSQSALARNQASSATSTVSNQLTSLSSGKSVLATSNGAIFEMANLMVRVRALSSQAGMLRASNSAGVDALRSQVNDALAQFNKISTTASPDAPNAAASGATLAATAASSAATVSAISAAAITGSTKAMSLDEMQKALTSMQTNLHENINKVGSAVVKAVAMGAQTSPTASLVGSAYSSNSLYSLWAKYYGKSGSSYL